MSMELLRRRLKLMGTSAEPAIDIIHPQWWHIKFYLNNTSHYIMNFNSDIAFTLREIVSSPENANVYMSGRNLMANKVGTYDVYFSISANATTAMYYYANCAKYVRLPNPYDSNAYLRFLYAFGRSGGNPSSRHDFYLTNSTPPSGPSNTALGTLSESGYVFIHVPKGSIENYINNSNTRWRTMYNAGRLIEENYNIIED